MPNKVMANAAANLIFYRRNRLLWFIAAVFLAYGGLSMVPALYFSGNQTRLLILTQTLKVIAFLIKAFALSLGVLTVWYQLRNRCYKMVVTRPCTPEVWLLGSYSSAFFVSLVLYLVLFAGTLLVFLLMGVPVQWGILYLLVREFASLVAQFSLLCMLCVLVHPFLAMLVFLLSNAWMFFQLTILTTAGYRAAENLPAKILYGLGKLLFAGIYFFLPSWDLNEKRTQEVWGSLRMEPGDLFGLGQLVCYCLLVATIAYCVTCFALRRKRAT